MNIEMETLTKFSIALYHLKTTISMRTKRLFEADFRHYNATEAMIIINSSIHQLLILRRFLTMDRKLEISSTYFNVTFYQKWRVSRENSIPISTSICCQVQRSQRRYIHVVAMAQPRSPTIVRKLTQRRRRGVRIAESKKLMLNRMFRLLNRRN